MKQSLISLLLRWVSLLRPAPFELPQGGNAARVKGCSGAIKGACPLFLSFFSGCSVARYRASMGCWRSSVQIRPSRRKPVHLDPSASKSYDLKAFLLLNRPFQYILFSLSCEQRGE